MTNPSNHQQHENQQYSQDSAGDGLYSASEPEARHAALTQSLGSNLDELLDGTAGRAGSGYTDTPASPYSPNPYSADSYLTADAAAGEDVDGSAAGPGIDERRDVHPISLKDDTDTAHIDMAGADTGWDDSADDFSRHGGLKRWLRNRRETALDLAQANAFNRRLVLLGPPGPRAGAVIKKTRTRPVVETTAQLAGTYPFVTDNGMGLFGQFVGRDLHSGAAFGWDPREAYRRKIVTSPVISLSGVIGSAKSSMVKTICFRGVPFGRKFAVPGDIRGEYVALCRALGEDPLVLGPGSPARYNPLGTAPRPDGVSEQHWAEFVEQHRHQTLQALAQACLQRPLSATEETAIELALAHAVKKHNSSVDRWAQPTLGDIMDWLLEPLIHAEEIRAEKINDTDRFAHECYELGLRFRRLVKGVFAGVFDPTETRTLDMSGRCTVVDMSRLQLNDAALALIVTCNQSAIELNCQFDPTMWLVVYDELWRYMRFLGLMQRLALRVKVVRNMRGGIPLLVSHRISDYITGDPVLDAVATGILKDVETHIIYRQAVSEIEATARHLALRSTEAALLPQLAQGTALWRIGKSERSMVVRHEIVEGGYEWPLIDTDQQILNGYREIKDPIGQMAELMSDAA